MSDLISRQKAISTAENMYGVCDTGYMTDYKDLVIEALEVLPSAERVGEWIEDGEWYVTRYRCSECGKYVSNLSNYCPDCGARMEGEKE